MRPVLAYHVVLTAYGFWLPNDPRGSWSAFVRSFALYRAGGPATKVGTRRSVAHASHDRAARARAKAALVRPPVMFSGVQARAIAGGLREYCVANRRPVHALAILPDHVHLIVGRCELDIETVATLLKGRATTCLSKAGLHPFAAEPYRGGRLPTPWARKAWSVFLDDRAEVRRAIQYVEANPVKAGYARQSYAWLTPFLRGGLAGAEGRAKVAHLGAADF